MEVKEGRALHVTNACIKASLKECQVPMEYLSHVKLSPRGEEEDVCDLEEAGVPS